MAKLLASVNRMAIGLIADVKTRDAISALADNLAVRSGEIGNGDQAFLTAGDLTDEGYKANMVANELARKIGNGLNKPGSPMFALADKLVARILALPEWHALFTRIGLLDAPETTPGSLAYRMLAEAKARGAAITNVQEIIRTAEESRAREVELITAAIGDAAAAIETEKEARVKDGEATAKVIETIASAVGDAAAAIQTEKETRVKEGVATAKVLETLVVQTGGNISGIEKKLEVRANSDNALAQAVNTLWAKVGDNTALVKSGEEIAMNNTGSVVTKFDQLQAVLLDPVTGLVDKSAALRQEFNVVNSRVDGMRGSWSIKLDLNGYVSGMSLNSVVDGQGVSRSNVLFNVDVFAIGSPGRPDAVPFAIDAVTGLVSIRGDLVARGSITAYQLAAESVDRDKLALKVVGGAQIDDLAVDTLQIKGNAVTVPKVVARTDEARTSRYDFSYRDIISTTIDLYQPGHVLALVTCSQASRDGDHEWNMSLQINGIEVAFAGGANPLDAVALSGARFLPAGRHSIVLMRRSNDAIWATGRNMTIFGVMK